MKNYPFVPKSNKFLKRGDFWGIKLPNGRYAAGVVLKDPSKLMRLKQVYIGLLRWSGKNPPTAHDLEGREVLEFGIAHIKAITEGGSQISGNCTFSANFRLPTKSDSIRVWGYEVASLLAEKHFAAT